MNDFNLAPDDLDDRFPGEPDDVSATTDLTRAKTAIRRRRTVAAGSVGALVIATLIAVPLVNSRAMGPSFTPAATTGAAMICSKPIDLEQAETDPRKLPVTDQVRLPGTENGKPLLQHAIASDGDRLIEVGRDERNPDRLDQLFVEDAQTGTRTPIEMASGNSSASVSGTGRFVAVLGQDFAAWIETTDTDWRIRSYARASGEVRTVASGSAYEPTSVLDEDKTEILSRPVDGVS